MLFNSPEFIFLFLPLCLAAFFAAARWFGNSAACFVLVAAALVFYAQWEPWHLVVLLGSMAMNYGLANAILAARRRDRHAGTALGLAVALNLGLLAAFKYAGFLATIAGDLSGIVVAVPEAGLPLGISFFTFTQITYLADCRSGRAERVPLLRYALFVTYFPHLVAGPILHHSDILPQFETQAPYRFSADSLADGLSLFLLGLAKKVMLADPLGRFADFGFYGAGQGDISFYAAWGAALSYTFQLYFDFSGYSDMALGLARMMNVRLPVNFDSPYRATSLIDFWRRWHMTLSRFLRDYVYVPLGGNRRGGLRRHLNLFLTMLLGGIWHGAGWTFVIWGALHGAALVLNHAVRALWPGRDGPTGPAAPLAATLAAALAWLVTFLFVVMAWVWFRAPDVATAVAMLHGMAGSGGFYLPEQIMGLAPFLHRIAAPLGQVPFLADQTVLGLVSMMTLLGLSLAIVLAAPNLYHMGLRWRLALASLCVPFCLQAVAFGRAASPFLYFQF